MKGVEKTKIYLLIALLFIGGLFYFAYNSVTGSTVNEEADMITDEQISCMQTCMGCTSENGNCTGNREQCISQCSVTPEPEPANEGEACMQDCIKVGCGELDMTCQNANMEKCEEECDMKGDAPDESEMSAEQLCISECVKAVDPTLKCSNSQEGETGGEVCQRCASDCVHLYEGPCLDDDKLKTKQKECETCEHCYGEPVMGDSGEGWDIVDVECKDASSEFGDNPGIGEGISKAVGNVIDGIKEFFSGLFGGESETITENVVENPDSNTETQTTE